MIVKDVRRALLDGRSPLLLTSRTEHVGHLQGRLRALCQYVFTLKGGMGTRQRKQIAESLSVVSPQEPRLILATGSYLGEGFDDARLDTLFLHNADLVERNASAIRRAAPSAARKQEGSSRIRLCRSAGADVGSNV